MRCCCLLRFACLGRLLGWLLRIESVLLAKHLELGLTIFLDAFDAGLDNGRSGGYLDRIRNLTLNKSESAWTSILAYAVKAYRISG